MSNVNDFNRQIIEEYRAKEGKVGGMFEEMSMLILHTTGRKSGKERLNPLAYLPLDEGWAIFASKTGAPTHPDWYHNIVADPDVTIELGSETHDVRARVAEGDERERIWSAQKTNSPGFAEYEEKARGREIPVVVLTER
jgi:deazaflavin-dependent oxidoreductase (nitroreductase family)